MALTLALLIFITVVLVVFSFGALPMTPKSLLKSRLRALGQQRPEQREKPVIRELLEQALNLLSKALPASPTEVSRTALLAHPGRLS